VYGDDSGDDYDANNDSDDSDDDDEEGAIDMIDSKFLTNYLHACMHDQVNMEKLTLDMVGSSGAVRNARILLPTQVII